VHFHLINSKTNNRIKMITTDPETGPIERKDVVRGDEVRKADDFFGTISDAHADIAFAVRLFGRSMASMLAPFDLVCCSCSAAR
jgi:non-homologous end joining protein Ku